MKKTICVGFDGVLHAYTSGWRGAGTVSDGPVPGAMAWLSDIALRKEYQVAIYSSRSESITGRSAMRYALSGWLTKYRDCSHATLVMTMIDFPVTKPAAWLTIDDRAFCFRGVFPTAEDIECFRSWHEGGQDDSPARPDA